MFESVNTQTDGRWLESHTISSPRAFVSGELKHQYSLKWTWYLKRNLQWDRFTKYFAMKMGLGARKPVFGGLRITQAQTSLYPNDSFIENAICSASFRF